MMTQQVLSSMNSSIVVRRQCSINNTGCRVGVCIARGGVLEYTTKRKTTVETEKKKEKKMIKCDDGGSSRVRMWKTRADALERSVDVGVVGGIGILTQDMAVS